MRGKILHFTAGGVLLCALLCFFMEPRALAALLLPVLVHECAHMLTIRILGLRVKGFRAELRGFCIEYAGYCGALGHALAAAAGPAAGFAYAFAASRLSGYFDSRWLELSAGWSLLLSIFNLLPALPLDGGRILENLSCAVLGDRAGKRLTRLCGMAVGALLLAGGMYLLFAGDSAAPELAAIWLLLSQDGRHGIVKLREIL